MVEISCFRNIDLRFNHTLGNHTLQFLIAIFSGFVGDLQALICMLTSWFAFRNRTLRDPPLRPVLIGFSRVF
jgi:hypothetical protein